MSENENQSLWEMLRVLEHIIIRNYGIRSDRLGHEIRLSGEAIQILFMPVAAIDKTFEEAQKKFPRFYDKMSAFMSDFKALELDDDIDFGVKAPVLAAANKTALLGALKAFAEEYDFRTFDDQAIQYPEGANTKKRKQIFNKMVANGRTLQQTHPDVFEDLFCNDPNQVYISEEHFMATVAAMAKASLPYSFKQIERMIALETAPEKAIPTTPDGMRIYMN